MIGGVVVGRVLFRNSLADSGPQLIVVAVELSPQEVEGDVVRAQGLGVLMGHLPGDGEGFERGEDGDRGQGSGEHDLEKRDARARLPSVAAAHGLGLPGRVALLRV